MTGQPTHPTRRIAARLILAILLLLVTSSMARADMLTANGDDPAAVTDQEGTTHVVWDVSHPAQDGQPESSDTIDYCRIPRGSATCADVKHLTPTCADQVPAIKRDNTQGREDHADGPTVTLSPFGDVVIATHGACPYDWKAAYGDGPLAFFNEAEQMLVFHCTDDGDTCPASVPDAYRAQSARYASPSQPVYGYSSEVSGSTYDFADNRLVTAQETQLDFDQSNLHKGLYVLGDQRPPKQTETDASRLSTRLSNGRPQLVQNARGSFAIAYSQGPDGGYLRTFDHPELPLSAIYDASNWTAEQRVPDDGIYAPTVKLVTGPDGTFVFYEANASDQSTSNAAYQFYVRTLHGATLGPRHAIAPGNVKTDDDAAITEDPATGRLIATIEVQPDDLANEVTHTDYVVSDDAGVTWSTRRRLADTPGNTDYADTLLTSATGDAGFTGLLLQKQPEPSTHDPTGDDGPIYATQLPGSGQSAGGGGGGGGGTGGGGGGTGGGGGGTGGGTTGSPAATGGGSTTSADSTAAPDLSVPPDLALAPVINPSIPTGACKVKQFGPLDIRANACFTVDPTTGAFTAKGGVSVNGLTFADADITFDPKLRTVKSSGPVTVSIGDTKLFSLPLDWKLPTGNTFTLPSLDIGNVGGKLEGFPVKGTADIKLVRGGVEIPLHVELPKAFGDVSGDVTLRADNLSGVHIRELHVKASLAPIGPLTLSNLEFTFNPDEKKWAGSATIALPPKPPGPVLSAGIGFSQGDLDYLRGELTFPGQGIPLDPFDAVHLTKIRFGLDLKPDLKLSGGLTLTAGPTAGDAQVAEINGDFAFTFPDGKPAILRADGSLSLLTIPVAKAYLQYRTDGLINFGGSVDLDVFDIIALHGQIDGWILVPKSFSVDGKVEVCVADFACRHGEAAISSTGFAACTEIAGADVGVGYMFRSRAGRSGFLENLDVMYHGCSVADYVIADPGASAAQADAPRTVELGAGLPFAVFRVTGSAAPPRFTLVSPDGRRIDATSSDPVKTTTTAVGHVAPRKLTVVVVHKPAAGAWKIEPADGSSPISSAGHADGLPDPSVHATVTGKGRARVLHYRVKPIRGQRVRFEERGAVGKAGKSLGYAHGNSGTTHFTPARGPQGRRRIVALVESFGTPRKQMTVASYTAPPAARPLRPSGLKVHRKGARLLVTWKRAAVARYQLLVTLSDGRTLLLLPTGKAATATVSGATKGLRATVTLKAQFADGTTGPKAIARLRR